MPRALGGVRILDFTSVLAGSYCTRLMANLGAEVIKVESPWGDDARTFPVIAPDGSSGYFVQQNCGKKSFCLDLSRQEAIDLVKRLVPLCDVVVEDFTPGTMHRLGLGYDALHRVNPAAIMCSITPYGQTGPWSQFPGNGFTADALAGVQGMVGIAEGAPLPFGFSFGDANGGIHALAATVAALYQRDLTGTGQHIDIAISQCALQALDTPLEEYLFSGGEWQPTRAGTTRSSFVPYGVYHGPDGYIAICAVFGGWALLAKAMGRPELANDERFATNAARAANPTLVEQVITEWLKGFASVRAAAAYLTQANVIAAPVQNIVEVANDPQLLAQEAFVELDHPTLGKMRVIDSPFHFSSTTASVKGAPPRLGEHTEELLLALLGYPHKLYNELATQGVIR